MRNKENRGSEPVSNGTVFCGFRREEGQPVGGAEPFLPLHPLTGIGLRCIYFNTELRCTWDGFVYARDALLVQSYEPRPAATLP